MASVNWQKTNLPTLGRMWKHFDNDARANSNHSNQDIDTSKTADNYYLGANDWNDIMNKSKQYIEKIDTRYPPKKKQSVEDRITMVSMNVPCPRSITDAGQSRDFFNSMDELYREQFGDAYMGMVVHVDEVHEYMDDGVLTTSCEHAHVFVCAHAKWKDKKANQTREGINGKNFETKTTLNRLNKAVDDMCLSRFGISYNTGGEVRKKSVEELKQKSYIETLKAVDIVNEQKKQAETQLSGTLEEKEFVEQELKSKQVIIENQQKQIITLSEQLQTKEQDVKEKDMELEKRDLQIQEKAQALKIANDEIFELERIKADLEKRCDEIHNEANRRIKEANDEVSKIRQDKSLLETEIMEFVAENQMKENDVEELINKIEFIAGDSFLRGKKAGVEGYEGNELEEFKAISIAKSVSFAEEQISKLRQYANNIKEKYNALVERYHLNADKFSRIIAGDIEIYTGRDGRVSSGGRAYLEKKIRNRLDYNNKNVEEEWKPVREHFWYLTKQEKDKLVQKLVQCSVDYAEDSCVNYASKYAPKSKIDRFIDKSAITVGKGVIKALQTVQQLQEEYIDEMER